MEIVIKGQALEQLLTACVKEFYSQCPELASICEEHVKDQGVLLKKSSGMSPEGTLKIYAAFPAWLYAFIKKQAHKRLGIDDVWRDPENYRLLTKIWGACKVDTQLTPNFHGESVCKTKPSPKESALS